MGLDLYAVQGSPPCRAVFLVAKAIGLDYNLKTVDMSGGQHKTPEFLKMNPAHTVPTLDDNGLYLGESKAIITYFMNKYAPNSDLYPKDPAARAVVDSRLFFDSGLFAALRNVVFPLVFMKDLKTSDANMPKVNENMDLLETFLTRSKYVAGDKMTIADLAILANISTFEAGGKDLSKWPHVHAWLSKLKSDLPYYHVNVEGAEMLGAALKKARAECESKAQ